jgi:hypothetical protein
MAFPTRKQIDAVQSVINNPARIAKLKSLTAKVADFVGATPGGEAPPWYHATNGPPKTVGVDKATGLPIIRPTLVISLSDQARLAAADCDAIAAVLLETSQALAHVNIPGADKAALRTAYTELADSWRERARVWRAPGVGDVKTEVDAISSHFQASLKAFARVQAYL